MEHEFLRHGVGYAFKRTSTQPFETCSGKHYAVEIGAQATDARGHVAANGHYPYIRAQVPDPGLAPYRGGAHPCAAGDGQALARFRRGLPRHHQHVGRVETRRHGSDDQSGGR